jgi:hypothetical protein
MTWTADMKQHLTTAGLHGADLSAAVAATDAIAAGAARDAALDYISTLGVVIALAQDSEVWRDAGPEMPGEDEDLVVYRGGRSLFGYVHAGEDADSAPLVVVDEKPVRLDRALIADLAAQTVVLAAEHPAAARTLSKVPVMETALSVFANVYDNLTASVEG